MIPERWPIVRHPHSFPLQHTSSLSLPMRTATNRCPNVFSRCFALLRLPLSRCNGYKRAHKSTRNYACQSIATRIQSMRECARKNAHFFRSGKRDRTETHCTGSIPRTNAPPSLVERFKVGKHTPALFICTMIKQASPYHVHLRR